MSDGQASVGRRDWLALLERYGSSLVLVLLIVFFAIQNERFVSLRNLTNILTEVSIYGVIAVGMTFVIMTRGVDLAVGSLVGFSGIVAATAVQAVGLP
ncbi:MAG: ABC transporter permease, partial [Brevundimonas sp.]